MNKRNDVLTDFFMKHCSVVYLTFDQQGAVLEGNRFTEQLVGPLTGRKHFRDIFLDFSETLSFKDLTRNGAEPRMLSLNTAGGEPQSFHFHFRDLGDEIIAIGQPDYNIILQLQRNLNQISSQLSNLNRDLQKKNAELTALHNLKNQFIGMAAHDLRSPIGHIMTCSDFLLEETAGNLDESKQEFLNIIRNSSHFMLNLINEILDLTVIESGHLNLILQPVDLTKILMKNVNLNRLIAEKYQIDLIFHHYDAPLLVMVDVLKIEQVLNNLISNALKYSPPHTTVEVGAFSTENDVIVSVKDQGPGIPEDEKDTIFKPFTRTSNRTANGEKNTGLGLAIANSIVVGHKGRIWVESQAGKGTTFFFSLTLYQEKPEI